MLPTFGGWIPFLLGSSYGPRGSKCARACWVSRGAIFVCWRHQWTERKKKKKLFICRGSNRFPLEFFCCCCCCVVTLSAPLEESNYWNFHSGQFFVASQNVETSFHVPIFIFRSKRLFAKWPQGTTPSPPPTLSFPPFAILAELFPLLKGSMQNSVQKGSTQVENYLNFFLYFIFFNRKLKNGGIVC